MARVESNGSFLVKQTGEIDYIGTGGGENQVVTFNSDNSSFESTNLEDLFGGACVSQYTKDAPGKRPKGAELEVGDFWTRQSDKRLHIWDGEFWVAVTVINGNPVGTIIQKLGLGVPSGYLACDGTPCPPQYTELIAILLDTTGEIDLPTIAGGYIKY